MTAQQPNTGDEVTLQELLEYPSTTDVTVRFICALRKCLGKAESLTDEEIEAELEISRMYHRLGWDRRKEAHEKGLEGYKHQAYEDKPQPVVVTEEPVKLTVVPAPPKIEYAPTFNAARAHNLTEDILNGLREKGEMIFTFTELKALVKALHLKNDRHMKPDDTKVAFSNGAQRWEHILQGEVKKLRTRDVIYYRKGKGNYLILPE